MAPTYITERIALSAEDLAQRLGVSLRHIRRMNSAHRLPRPVRIGHSVRWLAEEIDAWLKAGAPDRKTWEAMRGGDQ